MSITNASAGTHVSDGLRTGAFLQTQYISGANVLTPSVQIYSPVDTQPPGVFNTPLALVDVIPAPTTSDIVAAAQSPGAAGYLTLYSVSEIGVTVLPNFGGVTGPAGAAIIKLDCPRNISSTSSGNDSGVTITVFGWDQYGEPMVENIIGANATTVYGNKAFLYVQAVYVSGASAGTIGAGTGNTFGLPYFCPAADYFQQPWWNNIPDPVTGAVVPVEYVLPNNPVTTTNTSATVVLSMTSTVGINVGTVVSMAGLTATGGITAAELNITAEVTAVTPNTSISYVANGSATSSASGGGSIGTVSFYEFLTGGTIVVADQRTATATTGDVRGTYMPSTTADGIKRLFINFYAPSADWRKYTHASNPATVYLLNNALSTVNTSATVNVLAPGHQLINGETVTIAGATTYEGITAANLNLSNTPVTIVDQNNFTYVAGAAATGTGAGGGGDAILLTPSVGALYQVPIGRFGVQQYTKPLN
jgi:hypothetical protein